MRLSLYFVGVFALTLLAAFAGENNIAYARNEGIALVVNEDAISHSDINDRIKLIATASGLPDTKTTYSNLLPQVTTSLIDEQLKIQEARRLDISVSQEEIHQGFATIAAQNNMKPAQFRTMLQESGVNVETMKRQIESQISWSKIIQKVLRPQVLISEKDVDNVIERLRGNEGKNEYLVAEIFLPVESPEEENNVRQLATRLTDQIKAGKAPFFRVAQQFSKAAGAAQGGDIGWIQQGQSDKEIDAALSNLGAGEISAPVRSLSGYHILFLRDKRKISSANIPPREEIYNRIGLERLEQLQKRYILDLKSQAFIENRVQR